MSKGSTRHAIRGLAFIVALLGTAAGGCGTTLELDVQLVTRTCATRPELDPLIDATKLSITVYGPGVDPITTQVKTPRSDGTASLAVPVGKSRRFVVQALGGPTGDVVARGESSPLDLDATAGPVIVSVFLRRVDAFTPTSSALAPTTCSQLGSARAGHTATLLSDGNVLIAGGFSDDGSGADGRTYEPSTELYDPRTGLFSAGPAMALQRAFHTATRIPGTTLTLVAGGQFGAAKGPGGAVRVAELYDEHTRRFTVVQMVDARTKHAAAASTKGGLLLAGGYDASGVPLKTTEVFVPEAAAFVAGPSLPVGRAQAVLVPLADDLLFLVGGYDGSSALGRTELLRPLPGGGYMLANDININLREPRIAPLAGQLAGDRVLVAGGFAERAGADTYEGISTGLESVALAGSSGEQPAALAQRHGGGAAVGLPDGTVLVLGGAHTAGGVFATTTDAEIVARSTAGTLVARTVASGLRDGRYLATWTLLDDGTVLATGGLTVDPITGKRIALRTAEVFQPRYSGSKSSPYR